jgi:2-keto-4-pentenoate hydratase/2-oxohepta-3-ene-1,7-dioic acid hydratase in catechol pathway
MPALYTRYVRIGVGSDLRYARIETSSAGDKALLLDRAPWLGGSPTGEALAYSNGGRLAPVAPSKIVCIGTNYRAHAKEMGKPIPAEPLLFLKPPSSVIGPDAAIVRPEGYERTDFEGELGVVIGRRARHVSVKDALTYVFGYTIVNDVTVRDLQIRDVQFTRAKGFDTFCPVGPCVISADARDGSSIDPAQLLIATRVNGQTKQSSTTADLIFDVPTLISFISSVMTLEPGDLISTGTPPGVGPIVPGDRVEIEIEPIGILVSTVVSPKDQPSD